MPTPAAGPLPVALVPGCHVRFAARACRVGRVVALVLPVALLACQDITPVAPRHAIRLTNETRAIEAGASIILRGTIITPTGVTRHGYIGIANGRILSVSEKQPDIPGATFVNTEGIILPGFVDVHNHVIWNVLSRWIPGRTFSNQPEWNADPAFAAIRARVDGLLASSHLCDMNAWGELRALVGGTTSIMATAPRPCIHGLVRNLDHNSGFYGTTELNREHILNVSPSDFPPASDLAGRAGFVAAAGFYISNPAYEALVMHVAEGTDAVAQEQFTFLQSQNLLNEKGVLIHGISLGASDFQTMATAGTAFVWSPHSNLELYGTTANLGAALDAGVEIALAPDWALTGSSNMLDELKVAARWNRDQLGGRLTDRKLVDMATSSAARVVGVHDEVGAIVPGLRADLLVVRGDEANPLRAVIEADASDVQLVLIGGVPLYGARGLMTPFWANADLEKVVVPGGVKVLASPAAGVTVADVAGRLTTALLPFGASLASLAEATGR